MQAFVVRPFGTKEGINFGTIHEELIKNALKNAEIQGDTTAAVFEPGNIREGMFPRLHGELQNSSEYADLGGFVTPFNVGVTAR